MKKPFKNFLLIASFSVLFSGCSMIQEKMKGEQPEKQNSTAGNNKSASEKNSADSTKTSANLCQNKYYPVKDGLKYKYETNNNVTGKGEATMAEEFKEGENSFKQIWNYPGGTNLEQIWHCTEEGLIAPNYGSSATHKDIKITPKYISGVTLPRESEIAVGKTWTANYEVTTQMPGAKPEGITSPVKVENKILSLDDEVKTVGGTFKAMKVESVITMDLIMNGKSMSVPPIKSYTWYAPEIGMVKNEGSLPMAGKSTVEYSGKN